MFVTQEDQEAAQPVAALSPQVAQISKPFAVPLAAALVAACGGGGGGGGNTATGPVAASQPEAVRSALVAVSAADADAARFLQQAQFSSTEAEIAGLRQLGLAAWLKRQFDEPPKPAGWDWLEARGYGQMNENVYYSTTYQADFMLWSQLMSGPDMMRKRMALALSELFVASLESSQFNWISHAFAHYWDTLVKHAFGNWRDLLEAVTLHPAMGYYLNTKGNQKENLVTGRLPDENYAREVMQLFTIGLNQLMPDGSVRRDVGGNPIDSYTQADVSNLARVFTGYDFDTSDGVRIAVPGKTATVVSRDFARKPMAFDASRHSNLEAGFLGVTIAADTPGPAALKTALDTLFNHPNTGPFFARQMIQRLVTSNPSAAYVGRVANAFNNNGEGMRGDLRAVWSAILLDSEARSAQGLANPRFGKLREPMLRLIQCARSFDVNSAAGSWKIFSASDGNSRLYQSPLRAPSVFKFFRPGFVPSGTVLATEQAPAPEFQLVTETTIAVYLNYMQGVIRNGIYCPNPAVPQAALSSPYVPDVTATYSEQMLFVTNAPALVAHLGLVMCAGQLSNATQRLIIDALNATPVVASSSDAVKRNRIAAAVLMVMACADYLIQK